MRFARSFAALTLLIACEAEPLASRAQLKMPHLDPSCQGPASDNFNGAVLSKQLILSIPQQFSSDRAILLDILNTGGSPEQRAFATRCHGLSLP